MAGGAEPDKAVDDQSLPLPANRVRLSWHQSLLGKITLFFLVGVITAYGAGAAAGWVMFDKMAGEQWRRQAEMNAQIASSTIRGIYTFVAVDSDISGQVTRIVTERPIGDDDSILSTGFNPIDVLALAAAQTKNDVWLFGYDKATGRFVSIAAADGGAAGTSLVFPKRFLRDGKVATQLYTGFVEIGGEKHFVGSLPVVTPDGAILGAVTSSIGKASDLYLTRSELLRNSLYILLAVLLATGIIITLVVRRLFNPVPALIQALSRIARDDTQTVTPYRGRKDEIGHLAIAIETLREAVVEREHLRQVRDVAVQMEHMAHHDSLTGLPNRAFFNRSLNSAVEALPDGRAFNVMLLDLDRFKIVNDTLGHAIGDALLVAVADRIRMLLGPGDIGARLGGDEFAIIQQVVRTPMLEASRLAERMVEAISSTFLLDGHELTIGASIGISCAPAQGQAVNILLKNADLALYTSKATGRGNFHFFEDGMAMVTQHKYELERDLRLAIERQEFALFYQPILQSDSMTVRGYEALLRWQHPDLGLISPDRFIPLAEESGLIVALGEWVVLQACTDAARWSDDYSVALNVSPLQLAAGGLVEIVSHALEHTGLLASRIELEVTETVMLHGETSVSALHALKALGVGIVLDDFGTGYASLSTLSSFPFDKIKIDRSFVAPMQSRDDCRAIVNATINLARSLGIETTAEGVENSVQMEMLRLAGCTFMQGYLFGKPQALKADGCPEHPQQADLRNTQRSVTS
jgi:diguanylate cyclase (GGDEF)-like protein